jgi:hypothetical protein
MANPTEKKVFKYYDLIMAIFVTVLLCSNLIGPVQSRGPGSDHGNCLI